MLWGLLVVTGFDLALAHARFITTFDDSRLLTPPILEHLSHDAPTGFRVYIDPDDFSPDASMICNLRVPNGMESTLPLGILELTNAMNRKLLDDSNLPLTLVAPDRAAKVMAIKYLYTKGRLYFIKTFAPRARLIPSLASASREQIWKTLLRAPNSEPMVEGTECPAETPRLTKQGSAHILAEDANSITIETEAFQASWPYLADSLASGWSCRVDELPTPIHSANFAFRAVKVPPGQHIVKFVYWPPGFTLGLLVTILALGVLAFIMRAAMSFARARQKT